jgi:hypothetical protein
VSISIDLNRLSKLALIASDQSYLYGANGQIEVHIGDALAELRDTPSYDFKAPYAIAPGFVVDEIGEQDDTGFKFVALRNNATNEVIVAMGGTDGPDMQDWAANMKLGWDQWDKDGAGRTLVFSYLNNLRDVEGTEQPFTGTIHFTGQSLGGALAQYCALEFFQNKKALEPDVGERSQYIR